MTTAASGRSEAPDAPDRIDWGEMMKASRRSLPCGLRAVVVVLAGAVLVSSSSGAQRRGGYFGSRVRMATPESYDGAFRFCRILFRSAPDGDGGGWAVDYPRADENFSIRLSELTKAPISRNTDGTPNYGVLRLTDPELFRCPFVMMSEPGAAYLDEREGAQLRAYLQKGGFLWVDDFWGSYAWEFWAAQIAKVLSPAQYPIVDLSVSHPMFHTQFDVQRIPQIPNIGLWLYGHVTSERGADSAEPHARAILDQQGRVMVFMTHNADFGDSYQREAESRDYFLRFSVDGYAIGIDVLLYAMSH